MKQTTYEQSLNYNQKVLYINSLFGSPVPAVQTVSVTDKQKENNYQIQIVPGLQFLTYRIIHQDEPLTSWDSLTSLADIKELFRRNSLI